MLLLVTFHTFVAAAVTII